MVRMFPCLSVPLARQRAPARGGGWLLEALSWKSLWFWPAAKSHDMRTTFFPLLPFLVCFHWLEYVTRSSLLNRKAPGDASQPLSFKLHCFHYAVAWLLSGLTAGLIMSWALNRKHYLRFCEAAQPLIHRLCLQEPKQRRYHHLMGFYRWVLASGSINIATL